MKRSKQAETAVTVHNSRQSIEVSRWRIGLELLWCQHREEEESWLTQGEWAVDLVLSGLRVVDSMKTCNIIIELILCTHHNITNGGQFWCLIYSMGSCDDTVDVLKPTNVDKLPNDIEGMEASMGRLLALIDDVYKYVDDVVEDRVARDSKIGRFISDTIASLPKLSPHAFNMLVNDSIQDQLLLLYLSSITRTQLSVAEKLNTAAQIL
ncbi:Eukaryotic translation initiation factor 3 subunit F [Sesamum angolense]|uniref:Eukaryotic translation initiation factor 3 subunit F n=1 Tax=Sesamum angolense TaxID=2727404 RepID=A0AAE1X1T8_9LAMI|nr:Eukaryotic translation initiation factor 3 subunit F [Sesamum angolense]